MRPRVFNWKIENKMSFLCFLFPTVIVICWQLNGIVVGFILQRRMGSRGCSTSVTIYTRQMPWNSLITLKRSVIIEKIPLIIKRRGLFMKENWKGSTNEPTLKFFDLRIKSP
jgi:hypothetical protein